MDVCTAVRADAGIGKAEKGEVEEGRRQRRDYSHLAESRQRAGCRLLRALVGISRSVRMGVCRW